MKRSLSRIAALSLALGLATSTAHFASADILVPGVSPLPQNPALNTHRELIAEKYGNHQLPALTQDSMHDMTQLCAVFIDLCFGDPARLFQANKPPLNEEALKVDMKTFVNLYNIICGSAMRSTPRRIYIARDEKTKTVNLYMQTESHPVAECIGYIQKKGTKATLKLKMEAWAKLPHWKAPFVVIGPRQDAADFISAMEAEEPPVGACYLDGARVDLLAKLALSQLIPGEKFQDASPTELGIFIFFPNKNVLMNAISKNYKPSKAYQESVKRVKEKAEQSIRALGEELFAEKNAATFDEKAAWTTYGGSSKGRRLKACRRAYQKVLDQFRNTAITTDAVFKGNGPFYTLMRALWECAKTPYVEPDYTPDEEVRSFIEQIGAEKATEPTGESYGVAELSVIKERIQHLAEKYGLTNVEELSVIKGRIQHLAEEYGLTNEAQEAAARFVQALQEWRLDSSSALYRYALYVCFLYDLLRNAEVCGILSNVSLDTSGQLYRSAIVSNLLEEKNGDGRITITTEKRQKEELEKKVNHEVLRKRARNKYKKR